MGKFTKGKWGAVTRKADGNIFEVCVYVSGGGFNITKIPDAEANSHLIAAAPEMYAMLDTIETVLSGNSEYNTTEINIDYVRRLLAKARGEHHTQR